MLVGHQPAPGRAGLAGGVPGRHPGCGQGRLPPLRDAPSSRPSAGRPATSTAGWSCTPTRSPTPCGGPSTRPTAGAGSSWSTMKSTASRRETVQSGARHREADPGRGGRRPVRSGGLDGGGMAPKELAASGSGLEEEMYDAAEEAGVRAGRRAAGRDHGAARAHGLRQLHAELRATR